MAPSGIMILSGRQTLKVKKYIYLILSFSLVDGEEKQEEAGKGWGKEREVKRKGN